jgi:hypothetical protein
LAAVSCWAAADQWIKPGAEILDLAGQSTRSTFGDAPVLQLDKLGEKSITFYDSAIGAVRRGQATNRTPTAGSSSGCSGMRHSSAVDVRALLHRAMCLEK